MKYSWISLVLAIAPGLGVAACSETDRTANTDSATYDMARADEPCAIVTAQMVATTFDLPEANIEQSSVMSSKCSYEMKEDDRRLDVEVSVDAYETDRQAAETFRQATQSMSSEEVSDALNSVRQQAGQDGGLDTDAKRDAAGSIGSGLQQGGGIQFQDVDGVADQARFDTSDGTLQVLDGNLRIRLNAYYGPGMAMPDRQGSIDAAFAAWMEETMEERKRQSVKLAKMAVAEL